MKKMFPVPCPIPVERYSEKFPQAAFGFSCKDSKF